MMAVMVVMVVVGVAVTAMVMTVVAVPECGSDRFCRSLLMYKRSARRATSFVARSVGFPQLRDETTHWARHHSSCLDEAGKESGSRNEEKGNGIQS